MRNARSVFCNGDISVSYQFVLAYDASDIYDVVFSQLFSSPRTRIARLERSRLRELVEKIALSRKLKFPLKTYLGCRMAQRRAHEIAAEISPISEGTNWCVILLADQLRYERSGLAKEIKKVLPSAKIVVFLLDLIAKNADKQDLVQSKNKTVDTIVSFDSGEANRFGIQYHPCPFSPLDRGISDQDTEYDVCFVGRAKDRFSTILETLAVLNRADCRCYFYVSGVSPEQRVVLEGLEYGEGMAYSDYLKYVSRSKCLLEIVQGGGTDSTLRLMESIAFGKHLLSNCRHLEDNVLFDAERMHIFEKPNEIDVEAIKKMEAGVSPYRSLITPEHFLDDVEKMIGDDGAQEGKQQV